MNVNSVENVREGATKKTGRPVKREREISIIIHDDSQFEVKTM